MHRYINILIPFSLLVSVGSIIIFLFFPELAVALKYENIQHFFIQHLLVVGVGVVVLFVLYGLKGLKWFDIIGATILIISLFLLTVRLFVPGFGGHGSILNIGYFTIDSLPFFIVGVLWLVNFMHSSDLGRYRWSMRGFSVVVFLFWVLTIALYAPTAMLLGLVVLSILFYVYRSNKVSYLMLVGFVVIVTLFLLKSPYRLARMKSWIDALTSRRESVTLEGLDYTVSKLHDGLFIFNEWGNGVFVLVTALFTWFIMALWQSNDMFAKSVSILFGLDIFFHFIVFMNWSRIKPPSLFIVEQGTSITIASFLMMGMVLMRVDKNRRE